VSLLSKVSFFFCSNCLCRFFSVFCRRSQVWAPCPRFALPNSLFLNRRCCLPSDFISAPESRAAWAGHPLPPAAVRSGLPVQWFFLFSPCSWASAPAGSCSAFCFATVSCFACEIGSCVEAWYLLLHVWFLILIGEAGIILQLPDQKVWVLLVLITFTRWFPKYVRKVFDEIPVRAWTNFFAWFYHHNFARVLASIDSCFRYDSRFPNLVLRASSLTIAM
jgi:hypothetical protein